MSLITREICSACSGRLVYQEEDDLCRCLGCGRNYFQEGTLSTLEEAQRPSTYSDKGQKSRDFSLVGDMASKWWITNKRIIELLREDQSVKSISEETDKGPRYIRLVSSILKERYSRGSENA